MATGDIQYGLFGSSQFLTDHDVRLVAVGIDKNVHYDFLQSLATNRSPSNIFSLNGAQLTDAAPFIYRDICNSEYTFYCNVNDRILMLYVCMEKSIRISLDCQVPLSKIME